MGEEVALKACKCGGRAHVLNDFRDLVVVCPDCGDQDGYFKTRAAAIAAWNRRAGDA